MTEWFEQFLVAVSDEDIIFTLEDGLCRVKLGWCQTQNALDKFGKMTWPDSDDAVSWCAVGAILAINPASHGGGIQFTRKLWGDCFEILAIPLPEPQDVHSSEWTNQGQISGWNDTIGRTIDDVVELYETALIFARNPPPPPPPPPATVIMGVAIPTTTDWMSAWTEAVSAYAENRELPEGFDGAVPFWPGM